MMDGEEGDIGAHLEDMNKSKTRTMFPAPDADDQRKPRTVEEMKEEANRLAEEIQRDES
jgi:bis(5'-adenosyl)-triphosphatase